MEILGEIPIIQDDSLLIRRPQESDTSAVEALSKDDAVYKYLPGFLVERNFDDPVAASRYIESYKVEVLGIFEKPNTSELLGLVEIYDYDRERGMASIGYRLRSSCWGRGIGSRALKLVLEYLHTRVDVRLVTAHVMVQNKASMHVLENNGFTSGYKCFDEDWQLGKPVQVYEFVKSL